MAAHHRLRSLTLRIGLLLPEVWLAVPAAHAWEELHQSDVTRAHEKLAPIEIGDSGNDQAIARTDTPLPLDTRGKFTWSLALRALTGNYVGVTYSASPERYDTMKYQRCGRSGLRLPRVSLGLWHNFGGVDDSTNARKMLLGAFDLGVTHFDLANNYGPPPGSAEETLGRVIANDLRPYRDELVISTKAGYDMWEGPYGNFGSRKHLLASLDKSLLRLGLAYVDIFYHHRPDPETPLEETMGALASMVHAGKALYVGLSNYNAEQTKAASAILRQLGTPCLVHQPSYSMFNRWVEPALLETLNSEGIACIAFSPLAQGLLSNRYLDSIPTDSRVAKPSPFLQKSALTEHRLEQIRSLHQMARARGQSLAQMALAWVLRRPEMTSVLIGASHLSQVVDCVGALSVPSFSEQELAKIDQIVGGS